MLKISVCAFGKLKTAGMRESADYYIKLIQGWTSFQEVEMKPLSVPDKSESTRQVIQSKESENLQARLKGMGGGRMSLFLLDENGKGMQTQSWAKLIDETEKSGISDLVFCLASSLGFGAEMKSRASGLISLGPQTMAHELARVVLMEQIFRALSVLKGHPYHVN